MRTLKNQNYDAIVVGSGPGGATVAKELTNRKKKVLILEWGNNDTIKGNLWQTQSMLATPGKSLLFAPGMVALVRGICTGGSSIFYCGTAFDPPFEMFQSHGINLINEIQEAKQELPIAPLRESLLGPMSGRIMESANSLGFNWQKLPKFIFQDKCRSDCWRCSYGCPFGAKWTGRNYVENAIEKGATLTNNAKVEKVIVEKNRAIGVEYIMGNKRFQVFAENIILAAGGIGSPMILQASGIKESGKNFFYDPLIMVMGTVDDIKGGKEIPMSAGIHCEEDEYMMTDLTSPAGLYSGLSASAFRFHKMGSGAKTLQIMIKAKDSLGGKITVNGGVRKRLLKKDKQKLLNGFNRAKKILVGAGAKNIYKSWYLAAHPGGTAKIGHITDSNLMTKFDNLYVCDCSVMPDAWGLPPTLTIIGLGKRLAKHLTARNR